MKKGDVAFKGKSDGKATRFYILCNFKMNVLHFKTESKTFNITEGFYSFLLFYSSTSLTELV